METAAHPLRIGQSEVYVNPNPTIGEDTNQKDDCVLLQDLYDPARTAKAT